MSEGREEWRVCVCERERERDKYAKQSERECIFMNQQSSGVLHGHSISPYELHSLNNRTVEQGSFDAIQERLQPDNTIRWLQ